MTLHQFEGRTLEFTTFNTSDHASISITYGIIPSKRMKVGKENVLPL